LTCLELAAQNGVWPNCSVPDCENKACLRLGAKCWPHTVGLPLNWAKGMSQRKAERMSTLIERLYLMVRSR
jgi:hypothetical protein